MNPLISIIVPVYKVEKYLEHCIRSILSQTYKNIEVILVDDGSPDHCGMICDRWAGKDKRVKIIHKANGGISSARNAGLDIAKGEYLAFVDSDDYIMPYMIEYLYEIIIKYNVPLAITNFKRAKENEESRIDEKICLNKTSCKIIDQRVMMEMFQDNRYLLAAVAWNKLYRRDLFNYIRFPEGKICEDGYIMHEIFGKCSKSILTLEKLYYYRIRSDSILGSGYSIKNFTHLEGCYRRICYFEQNGYQDLCPIATRTMLCSYNKLRFIVSLRSKTDIQRDSEIREMVKKCYKRYGGLVQFRDKIKFICPRLYKLYVKTKYRQITDKLLSL